MAVGGHLYKKGIYTRRAFIKTIGLVPRLLTAMTGSEPAGGSSVKGGLSFVPFSACSNNWAYLFLSFLCTYIEVAIEVRWDELE